MVGASPPVVGPSVGAEGCPLREVLCPPYKRGRCSGCESLASADGASGSVRHGCRAQRAATCKPQLPPRWKGVLSPRRGAVPPKRTAASVCGSCRLRPPVLLDGPDMIGSCLSTMSYVRPRGPWNRHTSSWRQLGVLPVFLAPDEGCKRNGSAASMDAGCPRSLAASQGDRRFFQW